MGTRDSRESPLRVRDILARHHRTPEAERRPAETALVEVVEEAELAVTAVLDLLPVEGSWTGGYRLVERVPLELRATADEWATAAHHACRLHALIEGLKADRGE